MFALAIPVIGVLAAIAIPAYQDYTQRAHVSMALVDTLGASAGQLGGRAVAVEPLVADGGSTVRWVCGLAAYPADDGVEASTDAYPADYTTVDSNHLPSSCRNRPAACVSARSAARRNRSRGR